MVLFFFAFTNLIGQKITSDQKTDTWGDYYFINGNYTKAIRFFENTSEGIKNRTATQFGTSLSSNPTRSKS